MHWKDLKTLAIAVLLIVDAVFIFVILKHRHTEIYYPKNLIDSSISVFETSGLYVDRSFLTKKKERLPVYQGVLYSDGLSKAAKSLSQQGYLRQIDEKGIHLIGAEDAYFFGYDFSFSYHTQEDAEKPSQSLHTEDNVLLEEGERKSACVRISADFLKALLPDNGKFEYDLGCNAVYGIGEEYIAVFSVYLENIKTENEIYCRISNEKVSAADGLLCTVLPSARKKAENIGLCNLLFEEKAYIDALDESERKLSYILKDVSYSYGVYFDGNVFYLIPLCRITYEDGENRTYNFISGELYET
ncbi:MAG: hypothetical protein IKW18_07070 [Clostridia bacterium]|nr:hypothetical protein [Clostridia bacterium]